MPTTHNIGFADIIILEEDLAEIIVHQNIEIDDDMVNQIHDTLLSNLTSPFSVSVNKINEYSFDFNALSKIWNLEDIISVAVICYNETAQLTASYISSIHREKTLNIETFATRIECMDWIKQEKLSYKKKN